PDPDRRLEDRPAEALWDLAERFEAEGEAAAQRSTLRYLIERYPGSREASRAELLLERRALGDEPAASAGGEAAPDEAAPDEAAPDEGAEDPEEAPGVEPR
ncbi:MAG: hypothetical protein OEY14_09715, partial [Myxococcales bacterium]|nr:hypothetical protein [Myxococcales bacterium]